eukprot:4811209-Amphidinium_carterae.1
MDAHEMTTDSSRSIQSFIKYCSGGSAYVESPKFNILMLCGQIDPLAKSRDSKSWCSHLGQYMQALQQFVL